MTKLDEAKKHVRWLTYEQPGQQIMLTNTQADELRDALDVILQRLNRVESILLIIRHLEGIT